MPTKKRKQTDTADEIEMPSKRSKQEEKTDKEKRDKKHGKCDTEFHVVRASLILSISPIFASNPRAGVEEMLDSMVMRYIPALQGVVLSHSNLTFLTKEATIQADCPNLVCTIGFDATIWSPRIGMKLVGRVNLCSPDHISMLLHRTFNVSIPRHHIPTEQWEFEHGPAENDPEFGSGAPNDAADKNSDNRTLENENGGGKWVHRLTHEKLGGEAAFLEFTVIGLTVANEMLSLLGSLQNDPFSPEHVAERGPRTVPGESEVEDIEVEREIEPSSEEDVESTFKRLDKAAGKRKGGEEEKGKERGKRKKKK